MDWAAVSVVRAVKAESQIELVQTEHTARPWYVAAESRVQTRELVYDAAKDDLVEQLTGLQDTASVARPLIGNPAVDPPASDGFGRACQADRHFGVGGSAPELLGEVRINPTGSTGNWLSIRQEATVEKCKLVRSRLDLSQEAAVILAVPAGSGLGPGIASSGHLQHRLARQSAKLHAVCRRRGDRLATPPTVTIGPPEHVALPFQLFYPAEGVVTDSVALRAPNLGNKDRLSFNRVLRETRGGTLIVFADPMWPKIQTLVLSFSGLRNVRPWICSDFLETYLGEEIGLLDWEHRYWKGDRHARSSGGPGRQNSFSASFEFEGELVPA